MFHDLDATLTALVNAELTLPDIDISFVGPNDQFPPSGVRLPALSFFLYDIRENEQLRRTDWETQQLPGGFSTRTRAPARVLCSYLITAWPSDSAPNPAEDEHRMLGAALTVLLRHRKIPATYLRGELIDQEPPMPTRIITESRLTSMGEFWQAMGGKPKASLHYGITLSLDLYPATDPVPEVTERTFTIGQGVAPASAGRPADKP
jgi:hypothetical protein